MLTISVIQSAQVVISPRDTHKYGLEQGMVHLLSAHFQVILVMFGFVISFGIRCNVGVASVQILENNASTEDFKWSPDTVGYVDASFFWGYMVTQLPGGFLVSKVSATRLFGTAIFLSSCLNLTLPFAAKWSSSAVMAVRLLQGLVEGVTYPACHGILCWWAPPLERSSLATLAFSGSYSGAVLGLFVSGNLAEQVGWFAPFYFYGCAGIVWYLFWLWLAFDKPASHPCISTGEQAYIEHSLGQSDQPAPTVLSTPWLQVLVIFVCHPHQVFQMLTCPPV